MALRAKHDIAVRPRSLLEIQKHCPHVREEVIDSSHMVLQRRPRESWNIIASLLIR